MSASEPHRPRLHFSPAAGWLNDPNGLIVIDGVWHLFFQHHPHSTVWGPMHWGHASSRNLVDWREHPIALAPDALGTCFSGSAIESGAGEVKLLYTAHRKGIDGNDLQTQCLVHADRALTTFRSDPGNPVIDNPGLAAFRDPKVFWYEPTGRWIMVVTHGQSIGIRSSPDLVHWTLESVFGGGEGRHGDGPWECPDLLPLQAPDGTEYWVLLVGIGSHAYGGGSGTQYFVGTFDGQRFVNANAPEVVLWADYGRDYYAAQSFFGAPTATTIAWASNWQYAAQVPTVAFRGAMALPRELSLVGTSQGLRLKQQVPADVAARFELLDPGQVPSTGTYRMRIPPGWAGELSIRLFDSRDPLFVVSQAATGWRLRTLRHDHNGIGGFAHDYWVDLPVGTEHIDLFVDNGLVELFAADGLACLTNLHFPTDTAGAARVDVNGAADPSTVSAHPSVAVAS